MGKLEQAFDLFDAYNKRDPNVFVWENQSYPREYFLAVKLYEWILKLCPEANEPLLLASRCQHIGRWEIPRTEYPDGREAYLKWRKDLAVFHATKSGEILSLLGYDDEVIANVKRIVLKQRIKTDPEVQIIENGLCLVFLEFQYEDFYKKYPSEKIVNILKRSLLKMGGHGHRFALNLKYSEEGAAYIKEALSLIG